jgi:D-alanyl-D-alanine dipeptidase
MEVPMYHNHEFPAITLNTLPGNWREVPIIESNEKMISIMSLSNPRIIIRSMYFDMGLPGAIPDCYVREGVASRIEKALEILPDTFCLMIWDGWRPLEVQNSLYQSFYSDLEKEHPDWTPQKLTIETSRYVSLPSTNTKYPSPHLTGGALDLTISDVFGEEINMGTKFDAFEETARTRYFEELFMKKADLSPEETQILYNRRMLYNILTQVGFTNYHEEWWHYDYGNQFWGAVSGKSAIYGPILEISS